MRGIGFVLAVLTLNLAPGRADAQTISPPQRVLTEVISGIETVDLNCNRSGDLFLAVGSARTIYTSNCQVALYDSATGVELDRAFLRDSRDADPTAAGLVKPGRSATPPNDPGSRILDPVVFWDSRNGRFWVVAVEHRLPKSPTVFDESWMHIVVSKDGSPDDLSSDPSGDWWSFTIDMHADLTSVLGGLADRPRINSDGETLQIAVGRDFECDQPVFCPNAVPADEHRTFLVAAPVQPMLSGQPPALPLWSFKLDAAVVAEDTQMHVAAHTFDAPPAPAPQYYVATHVHPQATNHANVLQDSLVIGTLSPVGGGWSYGSQQVALPEEAWFFGVEGNVPNPSTPSTNVGLEFFWSAVFRNGSLWAAHHVRKNIGTPANPTPGDKRVIRWYEFEIAETGAFSLAQWGEIDDERLEEHFLEDGLHAFDPALAVNQYGDMAITYTIAGPTTPTSPGRFPSFAIAWRYRTNPSGTLPYYAIVRDGVTNLNTGFSFADYAGMTVDATGCLFRAHSLLAFDNDEPPGTIPPAPQWQSWTAELNICTDDMWADFDGDAALTFFDRLEFQEQFIQESRRADVDVDRTHTLSDWNAVDAVLPRQ